MECSFRYIKKVFGYSKVRYRGMAKNTNRLDLLAEFCYQMIGKKYLLA
jgi:IS5 family transposase